MSNLKSIISVLSMLIIMIIYYPVSVKAADSAVSGLANLGAAPAGVDELYLSRAGADFALTVANLFLYLGAAYDSEAELLALFAGKQAADADLTTYAGITPSANVQSLMAAANYAAMRTLIGIDGFDTEDEIEAMIFDADAESVPGVWTFTANPIIYGVTSAIYFEDADAPGADKSIGSLSMGYADGIDGAEGGDIVFQGIIDGIENVEVLRWDESNLVWAIPTNYGFKIGAVVWDSGDNIDGEAIADNSIDDDSIDWSDVTFADFTEQTAWRMFYSDASGDVTEFALGADNTRLTSNGAAAAPTWHTPREFSAQAFTDGEAQTTVTEAHMTDNRFLTDQGGAAETDLILSAISYYIDNIIVETEGNGFEICPPAGEAIYLDGTAIAANDCVDGGGTIGDKAGLSRAQIADGSYAYFITTIMGTWADGNDTGD